MRLAVALATLAAASPALGSPELSVDGVWFRDASGRAVILRGLDVAGDAKVPPFRPIDSPSLLDPLPGFGANVIRLLFTWEAYEPAAGQYDESYLDYVAGVADAAWARGLFVIVDFHQDAYSRFALHGCGDGFPAWTLPPGVAPAVPDNGAACARWGPQMVSDPDLPGIWNAFYADTGGARTRYLALVGRVAARLASHPGVVGYDLLNEPGGDEKSQIGPLYADAAAAIRAADPTAILFVSPAAITSAGIASQLDRPNFAGFAYAPHYYDPGVFLVGAWNGGDEEKPVAQMAAQAAAWGVPLFVGEFGAPPATDQVDGYLSALWARLDEQLASGAQWAYTPGWSDAAKDGWNTEDFSIVDGQGMPRANFRARPHPQRIAGTPTAIAWQDAPGAALSVAWDGAPGTSEIFAPASAFGGGSLAIDARGATCSASGDEVSCVASTAGPASVRITQAPAPTGCGMTGLEPLVLLALAGTFKKKVRGTPEKPIPSK
jgi:endoglycosylceramidase